MESCIIHLRIMSWNQIHPILAPVHRLLSGEERKKPPCRLNKNSGCRSGQLRKEHAKGCHYKDGRQKPSQAVDDKRTHMKIHIDAFSKAYALHERMAGKEHHPSQPG